MARCEFCYKDADSKEIKIIQIRYWDIDKYNYSPLKRVCRNCRRYLLGKFRYYRENKK